MRGPHRVEPEALHLDQVGSHVLARDDPTGVLVEVVTVHATDVDAPAVDEEVQAADLDPSESTGSRLFDDLASGRPERDPEGVAARHFRGPGSDRRRRRRAARPGRRGSGRARVEVRPACRVVGERQRAITRSAAAARQAAGCPGSSLEAAGAGSPWGSRAWSRGAVEPRLHGPAGLESAGRKVTTTADLERPGREVVGQAAIALTSAVGARAGGVQEDRPGDAAVPPLVLVFDVAGVGPLDDGQRDRVCPVGGAGSGRTRRRGASPCRSRPRAR